LSFLITVIIPSYNASAYIREAIESIILQTHKQLQILILDDGSVDDTLKIIRSFDDNRIELFTTIRNRGQAYQLNLGIQKAKGDFIAIMHADDIADIHKLEKQVNFMKANPEVGICGTWVNLIGDKIGVWTYPLKNQDCKNLLLNAVPFAHPAVMIRTGIIKSLITPYEQAMVPAEDYDLWVRLALITDFANLQEPLLHYRIHSNQIGRTADHRIPAIFAEIRKKIISGCFNINNTESVYACTEAVFNYQNIPVDNLINAVSILWACHKEKPFFSTRFLRGRLKHIIYERLLNFKIKERVGIIFSNKILIEITLLKTLLKILLKKSITVE
jgi:glycosyltransferase involved in cell wall biosynthesis